MGGGGVYIRDHRFFVIFCNNNNIKSDLVSSRSFLYGDCISVTRSLRKKNTNEIVEINFTNTEVLLMKIGGRLCEFCGSTFFLDVHKEILCTYAKG